MYAYNLFDQSLIDGRVREFRQQTERYLAGRLSEDQFRPLRLMNGLYFELHAPMLRVAIPYGTLHADQLRMLARIAREYDRGYGHFTTRQNIQFNWPTVEMAPDILDDLSRVQMHAIQSSGNCVRNITTDHLAGIAADEIEDPRPWCELIRQWFTLHPEFSYLPRKFKIAVTGSPRDRAVSLLHDIGLHIVHGENGERGFAVYAGGGMGRTPVIGSLIRDFLPSTDLIGYLEAILRVYNELGRRDNKHKARIKILVRSLGIEAFRDLVEQEWQRVQRDVPPLDDDEFSAILKRFAGPSFDAVVDTGDFAARQLMEPAFARFVEHNTIVHRHAGYRAVYVSLKAPGQVPGDLDAARMDAVADLAQRYSFDEVRTTHTQNLLLPHVAMSDLYAVWKVLDSLQLATPNISRLTDIICCPGLDYCSLANARSIPVAEEIYQRFADIDEVSSVGELRINISGCMNACGHHHVGHIGILGVEKRGEEWYQVTLGGSSSEDAALGERIGPAISRHDIVNAVEQIVHTYLDQRIDADESFIQTYRRIGASKFKERIYGEQA
ncbi:MAG: sulfite reductase [marine bacterium B5-7]|nr:MAG: sulfite reductase [marine bacterium B5-7]